MKMRDIAAQLKLLEIEMFELFLVHFMLNSLLSEYGLLAMCVQEEGRLNQERIENAHLVTQEKKPAKKGKGTP